MVFCHTEVTCKNMSQFHEIHLVRTFWNRILILSSQFLTCLPHALLGTTLWSVFCSLPYLAVSSTVVSLRAVLLSEGLQPFLLWFSSWFSFWFLLFLQQATQISSFSEVIPSCGTQPCASYSPTALSWSTGHACMSVCCLSDLLPVGRHSESVT